MAMKQISLIALLIIVVTMLSDGVTGVKFDETYDITWGADHLKVINEGNVDTVELKIDRNSGSGFESKMRYVSGFFRMRMKVPAKKDTTGIVISFYLHSLYSNEPNRNHDELDFEFLGANTTPWVLQTNLFLMDTGFREQKIKLGWFDPTTEFHNYTVLWNQHHIVFFIDEIPIRVFKNFTKDGGRYSTNWMKTRASIWDATPWESGGPPVNWTNGPSWEAYYQGFEIDGCEYKDNADNSHCYDPKLWWNGEKFTQLDQNQQKAHDEIREKYMFYDYCKQSDASKFKECELNNSS